MNRRIAIVAALAITLLGAAACNSTVGAIEGDTPTTTASAVDGRGTTIKVWLMGDAGSVWPEAVEDATQRFTAATGAQVLIEYQQRADHLTRLDATLARQDAPDVVELGNAEFSRYIVNGAFAQLTKADFENSSTWLTGLSGACDIDGRTYCVPYYAGAQVLIYRKDLFEQSGIEVPTTYAALLAAGDELQADNAEDPDFMAFYLPTNIDTGMAFMKSEGGEIAIQRGDTWVGQLSTPASQQGLHKYADLVKKYSKADPTEDEYDQAAAFAQGRAGGFIGNGWEKGAAERVPVDPNDPTSRTVDTEVVGKLGLVPVPEIPSLLSGANLGVTEKSRHKALAAQWIRFLTDDRSMAGLIAKNALPNSTVMLRKAAQVGDMQAIVSAAKNSFLSPNSPKWADVRKATVMQDMFRDILTGDKSVVDAAAAADAEIDTILNAS